MSDSRQLDISLCLNQPLIECQILALFDVQPAGVHDMPSTDDVKRVLSHLKPSQCSTLWYMDKQKTEDTSSSLTNACQCRHESSLIAFAFLLLFPRVIAVSSLLLKPCQSAWTKWQAGRNWITEKGAKNHLPLTCLLSGLIAWSSPGH